MKTETVRVRVEGDIMTWLRRAAAKRRVSVSDILRELILPAFEARHDK